MGNCHVYVDASADIDMAAEIVFNAKTSRPSVCNAMETLLVHRGHRRAGAARDQSARWTRSRWSCAAVNGRARILADCVVPADEEDWGREYLDYILAVKVVDSL